MGAGAGSSAAGPRAISAGIVRTAPVTGRLSGLMIFPRSSRGVHIGRAKERGDIKTSSELLGRRFEDIIIRLNCNLLFVILDTEHF